MSHTATLILTKGKIHTLDRENPLTEAVAIANGKILATGNHDRIMRCVQIQSQRRRQPLLRHVSGILRNVCRTRSVQTGKRR